ncbi:MAG: hypothetical protein IIX97_05715 [Clostridia bacterium]|nr:hypothetical protein [Clostridia bacterium]
MRNAKLGFGGCCGGVCTIFFTRYRRKGECEKNNYRKYFFHFSP